MKQAFIDRHINIFLQIHSESNTPLDLSLSNYFRSNKCLGATDRRVIGDTVYGMARWKSLIDFFAPQNRLTFYQKINWETVFKDLSIPIYARLGLSEFLYNRFSANFGEEKAQELGQILNQVAPTTIRVNLIKTTREQLTAFWKNKFTVSPCTFSPSGIQFHKREPLFSLPEFKDGLFEMQDEGSQLIAGIVEAKAGDCVLDYCSGSGGKTLAFAPSMQGKGQIYLHDIRQHALYEARRRLKRAGIQNAQCLPSEHPQLRKLTSKCDWVLIDVPCSGTGTLRRNPDQKWEIDASLLERLIEQQRAISHQAIKYVKPGGRLVYATCSILSEENDKQVSYLLENYPLTLEKEPVTLLPVPNGMDGFFCAVFRKKIQT